MKTIACLLVLVPAAYCLDQQNREERIVRTLRFTESSADRSILVDNIQGSITVSTHEKDVVEMVAVRTTKAESESKHREAGEDVILEIREQRDRIEMVVEAPWRSRWEGIQHRGYRYYGYDVSIDFELKVPERVNLYLRTVDDGDIDVRDVRGSFEVKNVNGDVRMAGMAGSGRVSTVNGSVTVGFKENPSEECLFRTVNGEVEVSFQDPLSAEILLKTFNGNAYTEFDVEPLPRLLPTVKDRKGKQMYKAGDAYAVRVGGGGPRLGFDTLNGSIHILKHQ